jgi:hypothetical protein
MMQICFTSSCVCAASEWFLNWWNNREETVASGTNWVKLQRTYYLVSTKVVLAPLSRQTGRSKNVQSTFLKLKLICGHQYVYTSQMTAWRIRCNKRRFICYQIQNRPSHK